VAEIYRVFQIILGIILSVFILFILINYSGGYAGVQGSLNRATIIKNFITDSRSVYFTGNAINFTDFDAYDFSACEIVWRQEPHIICVNDDEEIRSEELYMPVFFNTDSGVVITRNVVDYGWWEFHYVMAPSRMRVLLNPLEIDDGIWNLMKDVVSHLPDTSGFSPRTTYGFCDGAQKIEMLCSESLCEQKEFSSLLSRSHSDTSFYPCITTFSKEYRVISFSNNCNAGMSSTGICVTPKINGAGKIFFYDTGVEYTYTDMADVAAAVIGGTEQDIFRKTGGENFLEFKRKIFNRLIGLAAEEMTVRSDLVITKLPAGKAYCIEHYSNFRDSMEIILQIMELDLDQIAIAQTFTTQMNNAGLLWQELINNGCEYID